MFEVTSVTNWIPRTTLLVRRRSCVMNNSTRASEAQARWTASAADTERRPRISANISPVVGRKSKSRRSGEWKSSRCFRDGLPAVRL